MSGVLQLGYNYALNETRALSVDSSGKLDIDVQVEDLIMKANDGNDGSGTDRTVKCDANGELQVAVSSAALPTGASTLAEQQAQTALLTTMDADTSALAGCVGGTELQVDVVSSALPAGAATEATLANLEGHMTDGAQIAQIKANTAKDGTGTSYSPLVDADGHLQVDVLSGASGGTQYDQGDALGATPTGTLALGKDGSGNAQPFKVNVNGNLQVGIHDFDDVKGQATMANSFPVVIASDQSALALPTGASTLAEQQAQTALLTTMDADTSALAGCVGGTELQVDVVSSALPSGASTLAEQQAQTALLTTMDADTSALAGCVGGTELQVDVVSSALPAGAATLAEQSAQSVILTTINADTSTLAGCVGGTELQVDVVSSALPSGAATSANQTTVISSLGSLNSIVSTLNGKKRPLENLGTSQTSIAVASGSSAVSSSIDTEQYARWSVVCKDNSSGNLHFIVQQSWDNSTWFGEALVGGGTPLPNSVQTYEADNSTSTGYFYFTNSEGRTVSGGGGGGGGSVGIEQYARYIRIQAYDTVGSATSFDVRWYQVNNA